MTGMQLAEYFTDQVPYIIPCYGKVEHGTVLLLNRFPIDSMKIRIEEKVPLVTPGFQENLAPFLFRCDFNLPSISIDLMIPIECDRC